MLQRVISDSGVLNPYTMVRANQYHQQLTGNDITDGEHVKGSLPMQKGHRRIKIQRIHAAESRRVKSQ